MIPLRRRSSRSWAFTVAGTALAACLALAAVLLNEPFGPGAPARMDCGSLYKSFWEKRDREMYQRISPEQLAGVSRMALRAFDACEAGDEQDAKALFERLGRMNFSCSCPADRAHGLARRRCRGSRSPSAGKTRVVGLELGALARMDGLPVRLNDEPPYTGAIVVCAAIATAEGSIARRGLSGAPCRSASSPSGACSPWPSRSSSSRSCRPTCTSPLSSGVAILLFSLNGGGL